MAEDENYIEPDYAKQRRRLDARTKAQTEKLWAFRDKRKEQLSRTLKYYAESQIVTNDRRGWGPLAQHSVDCDMDELPDDMNAEYDELSDTVRTRLLVNGRHDAAMAFYAAADAYKAASDAHKEARYARIWSWFSFLLNIIMLGILVYAFFL